MTDFEKLLVGLHNANEKTRARSAFRLGCMGHELTIEPLISAFRDSSARVRRQVVFALSKFNDPGITDLLIMAIDDPDMEVRRKSIAALRKLKDAKAIEGLTFAFHKEHDGYMRAYLLSALGWINDIGSRDLFISALSDSEKDVREVALAIQKLAIKKQMFDVKAMPAVIALLDDERLGARAIRILGNLGDPRAIEPIENYARNRGQQSDYFQQLAQEAITHIREGKRGGFPLWI